MTLRSFEGGIISFPSHQGLIDKRISTPSTRFLHTTSEVPMSPEPYAVKRMALQDHAPCALCKFSVQAEVGLSMELLVASTMQSANAIHLQISAA